MVFIEHKSTRIGRLCMVLIQYKSTRIGLIMHGIYWL